MKTSSLLIFVFVAACQSQVSPAHEVLRDNDELFRHILVRTGHDANELLSPGDGLDVYMVRLDELSRYDGKSPFAPLLHDMEQRFVPLHGNKGEVRTSMTMMKTANGWKMARAGAENLTRLLVGARNHLGADHVDTALVRIPGLQLELLVSRRGPETLLTPVGDDARLGLAAHRPESAARLLARLAPAAQRVLTETTF
jgi:hypothetical protein